MVLGITICVCIRIGRPPKDPLEDEKQTTTLWLGVGQGVIGPVISKANERIVGLV